MRGDCNQTSTVCVLQVSHAMPMHRMVFESMTQTSGSQVANAPQPAAGFIEMLGLNVRFKGRDKAAHVLVLPLLSAYTGGYAMHPLRQMVLNPCIDCIHR